MAVDFNHGPFGRRLPQPSTSLTSTAFLSDAQANRRPDMAESMMPRPLFSKDGPFNVEASGQGHQLPPVSHLLGGRSYHEFLPEERPPSEQALPIFQRPPCSRGISGEGMTGPPGLHKYSSHRQHYRYETDVLPASPFAQSYPHQDPSSHIRSIPPLLSRPDGRASSGSDTIPDQSRVARLLREENLPGRGPCYIYDDGSFCPKAIDGDSVNPQWGVTKAGRPRKRLAQACTTCREKKIRCDPGSGNSKCSQCLKFNRDCRFEQQQTASRPDQRSPSLPTTNSPAIEAGPNASLIYHRPSGPTTEQSFQITASSKASIEVDDSISTSSLPMPTASGEDADGPPPSKRIKASATSPIVDPDSAARLVERKRNHSVSTLDAVQGMPEDECPVWDQDPFEFDPNMTEFYLDQYFTKINYTTYCMFPKKAFMDWVRKSREKTTWDRMLLYAMMALGTIFAANAKKTADGKIFSRIAECGISESAGVFNLQVVQSRLILAMYHFAQGSTSKSWDFAGSAVRVTCGMRLNLEEGVADIEDGHTLEYGFARATLVECRRRTFWSAYLVDRLGLCSSSSAMFHNEDCLLRLPCNEKMYEEGTIPSTPFFDSRKMDPQLFGYGDSDAPGMMAYLVQLASIWGEVLARTYRSRYQPPSAWGTSFEDFYRQTFERLEAWERSLTVHLRCSTANLDRAGRSGHLGSYGALHLLYHCTMMKLNRYARYDRLPSQHIDRNVKRAYDHACKTLDLVKAIAKAKQVRGGKRDTFGFAVSSPLTGFSILTAIDIVTAAGSMSDLLNPACRSIELLAGGISVMTELSENWSSAKGQLKLVEGRFEDLMATCQSHGAPQHTRVTAFFARDPLETTFGLEHDLVYALPRRRYLEALGWGSLTKDGDDMLEVLKRGSNLNTVPCNSTTLLEH